MIPTYSPVVNVDGAYSLIAYDTSRMVSGLPPRPAAQRYWPLPSLSLRILRTAVRWKIQRTEGLAMYGALRLNLALISPSAVRLVVVLSVLTSRPVLMPLAEATNTPSGWPAPVPVRNACSSVTACL